MNSWISFFSTWTFCTLGDLYLLAQVNDFSWYQNYFMHWSSFGVTPDTRLPLTVCWSNWCQRSAPSLFPQITAFSHKSCSSLKMVVSSQPIWGGNCWSQTQSLMSRDAPCVSEFGSGGSQRGSKQYITVLFLKEHTEVDINQDYEGQIRSWSKSMHFIWYLGMVPVWFVCNQQFLNRQKFLRHPQ